MIISFTFILIYNKIVEDMREERREEKRMEERGK